VGLHSVVRLHREDTDMAEPGAKWRCMDPGSLRTFVVAFAEYLAALGHTNFTVGVTRAPLATLLNG
jgi:hypothetical protein